MMGQNCRRLLRLGQPAERHSKSSFTVLTWRYHKRVFDHYNNLRNVKSFGIGSATCSSSDIHKHDLHFSPTILQSFPSKVHYPIDFNDLRDNDREVGVPKLVKSAQEATKNFGLRGEAVTLLDDYGAQPNDKLVYLAIWTLRDDWESALLVFNWGAKWGCSNDEKLLGLVVWVLGTHKRFSIAWRLIRDSHQSLNVNTGRAMLVMIERYAAANFAAKSIKTFHMMEKLRLSTDQNAFYTLLCALCTNGNVEEAEEIMLKNRKLFPLQTDGFNIILNGWCNIFVDVFEAKRVWREMSRYCITPDANSYMHLISCFSKVGNLFDSLRLFDEMKKRGWIPGLEIYNSLMYVLTRENCLNEAFKMLEKLKAQGFRPNSSSFDSLICPLCETNKFEDARVVLNIMTQENVSPSILTYHAFLEGATFESILEVLEQMKRADLGPNDETLLVLLNKFFKIGQAENALKIWFEMRNYGVGPNSAHYALLVQSLLNCGYLGKAREMYTEMTSSGFQEEPKLKRLLIESEPKIHYHRGHPPESEHKIHHHRELPPSIVRHFKKDILIHCRKHNIRRRKHRASIKVKQKQATLISSRSRTH